MKAWFVFIEDEWGELVHADTRGKAKFEVMCEFNVDEFISLQAHRVKRLDDKPFTFQNLIDTEWKYVDEDGQPLQEIDFYNSCTCEICKGAKVEKVRSDIQ